MFRLEARAEPSKLMGYLSPLSAVVMTLITGMMIFALLGKDPIGGFVVFFINPISSVYGITELLLKATPLMLCALGLAIGFRANIWNIGAEGQFIMGATAASAFALHFDAVAMSPGSHYGLMFGMMVSGALGGMAWAFIPAVLKTKFNANEILTSLMLVYIAQLAVSWLVFGPMRDPDGQFFPQTKIFADGVILPVIMEGSRLTIAFPFTILLLILGQLFMKYSFTGYKMRVAGEAEAAARYAGFSANRMVWIGLLAGGATAGIAGMAEAAGPMGQLTDKVSTGYGFAAIIVAYVGRLTPVGIFFSGLLMALFFIGGEQVQQYLNLPNSISKVFQGMLLFYLLANDIFINYRVRWSSKAA